MVLLNQGLNVIRDAFSDKLDSGICGLQGTSVSVTDTSLSSQLVSSQADFQTQTKTDKQIDTIYVLSSTIGAGTTFKEYGILSTEGTVISRVVYSELEKASDEEFNFSHGYFINRG
jgi:hypothetical protein